MKLNLGCGNDVQDPREWINIDKYSFNPDVYRLDIEDLITSYEVENSIAPLTLNSITHVKAHHVLEHVYDLTRTMKFIHAVCVNGAEIDIVVPLANTLWAVANPDHKILFNHRTFQYFSRDFITSDLGLFRGFDIISQTIERDHNEWFGGIEWIVANLHTKLAVVKE